jgi:hypothetical protein
MKNVVVDLGSKKYVDKREMFAYIQNIKMNIIVVQVGTG